MKKETYVNGPNDKVVIIGQVIETSKGIYSVLPLEAAIGKINAETNEFTCMDNKRVFPALKEIIHDRDDFADKLYYFVPRDLSELMDRFHIDPSMDGAPNTAAIAYLKNIFEHIIEARIVDGDVDVRFIEKEKLKKMPTEPNLNAVLRPTIIIPNNDIKVPDSEDIITPSQYVNPLGVKIDLEHFIDYMNKRIVDNEDLIEDICTTISYNLTASDPYDVENILAIGPTGSGKTETLRAIKEWAKGYKIPVVIFDSSSLSSAGYVGKSVEDFLRSVYFDGGKDPSLYERAILGLDELDKLKMSQLEMKEAAQDSLLKLVEGNIFDVELDKFGSRVNIDTTGMTMYGLGAFSEIFEKKKKEAEGNIGFSAKKTAEEVKRIRYDVTDKDLAKYGFKSEFIPRFQNKFVYIEMDRDGLMRALTTSPRSVLLRTVNRLLEQFNTKVIYDESFLEAYVDKALESKAGGRSLNKVNAIIFKKAEQEIMKADLHDDGKRKVLKLTSDTVANPRKFDLE